MLDKDDFELPVEDDFASIRFLTVLAYRPKTKTYDPAIMADVLELERMQAAGEPMPQIADLPEWRKSRSTALKQIV